MVTPPTGPARGTHRALTGLSFFVATAGGSGYSPIAPGTVGSAVGLILFIGLVRLPPLVQLAAVVLLSLAGVFAGTRVARHSGIEDPGIVVVDEVAGMWVSLLFLPFTPVTAVAGFLLFRVLDVVKPWPARRFEDLPGGWGIMCDDLMAGVYANILLRLGVFTFA